MEAHTQFGAATAMHMLYQHASRLCAHNSNITAKISLFTYSQASDIHTFRHNRLAAKLHKLAQVRYT